MLKKCSLSARERITNLSRIDGRLYASYVRHGVKSVHLPNVPLLQQTLRGAVVEILQHIDGNSFAAQ